MVIPSYGATEANVPDIVDAIVDLTETGSSLRRNGLKILHTLLTSYTELVANPAAHADEAKRAAMEDVALLLRGAIMARGSVLAQANVASSELAAVTEILPAMTSPTITSLARGDMSAVEAVVPKRGRQHAHPGAARGGRTGHPGDPDFKDCRIAITSPIPAAAPAATAAAGWPACLAARRMRY